MGSSYICIGNNPSYPNATGNTCTALPFFDGGFITVDLPPGQYVYIYRAGSSSQNTTYNISQLRLYGMPNLIATATIITTYVSISAAYGATNLITNLSSRTARWSLKPLINAAGASATFDSCFRVAKSSITGPEYVFGLDHRFEKMQNSVLLVIDHISGLIGSETF